MDVWLYLLAEGVDFNEAYCLGYDRVGCWCCPNNTQRAQLLSRIYMPEKSKEWRNFLIFFAKKVGKPDPEVYVDEGCSILQAQTFRYRRFPSEKYSALAVKRINLFQFVFPTDKITGYRG